MLKIKIGTRGSPLALAQTKIISDEIQLSWPDAEIIVVPIRTSGDKNLSPFSKSSNNKGMFTFEIEQALINHEIDIAVHSLKDLPVNINENLPIKAYSKRGNPFDALVTSLSLARHLPLERGDLAVPLVGRWLKAGRVASPLEGKRATCGEGVAVPFTGRCPKGGRVASPLEGKIATCGEGVIIGSSSLRRKLQLEKLYPDSKIIPVRGNVNTRISKLDSGEFDGIVLACAGLERMNLENRITKIFNEDEIMPAPGQGVLVCQGRRNENYFYLESVNDEDTELCAKAERSFAKALNAGCNVPVGAYAKILDEKLILKGLYIDEESKKFYRGKISGDKYNAGLLGEKLAKEIFN